MTIWKAEQVKIVNLNRYNIIEYNDGNYFIGNNMDGYGARVSTKIQEYSEETKSGITASKTMYQLHGKPGLDDDSIYLLEQVTSSLDFKLRW